MRRSEETSASPSVGPWEVQEILDAREFEAECSKVLLIHGPGGDIAYAAYYSLDGDTAKQRANARLIAAAPELLTALIDLYALVSMSDIVIPDEKYAFVTAAAAAIAKAGAK